jgi:EAL domain-containing protein (putative c-di-GMP-specific phosphodiesterase class I)/Arc/MetJ family transcription regulator
MTSLAVGPRAEHPGQNASDDSGTSCFRDFAEGEYLFRQDDPGDCAYFIESGIVEVLRWVDQQDVPVARVSPGGLVGELTLIDGEPRMASARAATAVRARILDRAQLAEKIEQADPLLRHLLRVNLRRYREYATQAPGDRYTAFEDDQDRVRALEQLASEQNLEAAIRAQQMELHYQPIVVSASGDVAGFEALVRWRHPERGLLMPGEFIPLAESSQLIRLLGAWVLQEGARMAAKLSQSGRPLFVNVNLSPFQFDDESLAEQIIGAARDAGAPAEMIRLEITESLLMSRGDRAVTTLDAVRAEGFKIAIDDFGTGYSSLSRLYRLPVDILKFDRFLTQAAERHEGANAILSALVGLARTLGMISVGEGVETDDQARMLRGHGVDFSQGYFFGRPVPAAEALALAGCGA